jgi:hypothetical protein
MSTDPFDATVHANLPDGGQVVRYDHASRWYLEYPAPAKRKHITLAQAVELALQDGARVPLGIYGGTNFDARYRAARQQQRTRNS